MKKIKFKLPVLFLSKRQVYVVVTAFLTFCLFAIQQLPDFYRYPSIIVMGIVTYFLTAFCLREELEKHEWITLLILPTLFTISLSYFYFLLPVRLITRLPMAIFYALGYYALLLTENIFNVSSLRSIQLLRAAQAVGFYLTLITFFFFSDLLFTFHALFVVNLLLTFIFSFLLFLQYLSSINLAKTIEKRVVIYSLCLAVIIAELAMSISFWPLRTLTSALFLTSSFYALLGIGGYEIQEKLSKRVVSEFIFIPVFVFVLLLLTTSWTY